LAPFAGDVEAQMKSEQMTSRCGDETVMRRDQMFVRQFAFVLVAMIGVVASPAFAQHGGGHGGGGFHGGGAFHGGGFHGGFHDHFHGGFHDRFHGGPFVGGFGGFYDPFFEGYPYYGYPYYGYPYYGYPYYRYSYPDR
jgi:hypothetical protein